MCNVFFQPHSSTIRSWAAPVNCEPGFFCDVIWLTRKVAKTKPYMSDDALIIDAMALHKGTWWDQKKRYYIGRVHHDTALPEACDNLATEALFSYEHGCFSFSFLICSLSASLKKTELKIGGEKSFYQFLTLPILI